MNLPENGDSVLDKVQFCTKIIKKPDVNQFMVQMLTAKSPDVVPLLRKDNKSTSAFSVKASLVRQDPVTRLMKTELSTPNEIRFPLKRELGKARTNELAVVRVEPHNHGGAIDTGSENEL